MAEARMAVAPQPALHRFGHEVDTSIRVPQIHISSSGLVFYIPPPRNLLLLLRRRVLSIWSRMRIAFMPLPISLVFTIAAGVCVWTMKSNSSTWQRSGRLASFIWGVDSKFPWSKYIHTQLRVGYLSCVVSGGILLSFTAVQRYILQRLLAYHGWLYERKERSLKTKIWAILLSVLFIKRTHNNLHAYQGALPTLPLPSVEQTITTYLTTMESLLNDTEMQEMRSLAAEFLNNEGPRIQWYLRLKWLISDNYISDWWRDYVYLRSRESLAINSNWGGIVYSDYIPTSHRTSRTASVVYHILQARRQLESDTFPPQRLQGLIPICMDQYENIFSTTRIPGVEQDTLVKVDAKDSRHVVVFHNGRVYRVQCYCPRSGRILTPYELEATFESIINDNIPADPLETLLPSLTCLKRNEWAIIRENYFVKHHINSTALQVIESAIFCISLDEDEISGNAMESKSYLCGNGHNRWADKSFTLCIGKDARVGIHVEHSFGDAPVVGLIMELSSLPDEKRTHYGDDGRIQPSAEDISKKANNKLCIAPAERLHFQINQELGAKVKESELKYTREIADLDLHVERFTLYGQRLAKRAKCSPDAWIQMALQLAYYRDQGRFDQTYEPCMTRLFRSGRTETIRSASNESCAFVRAMEDSNISNEERLRLLRVATEKHTSYSLLCMKGYGVDRHLFGMYIISVGKGIPSSFLTSALSRKWKLSTSQIPARQLPEEYHEKELYKDQYCSSVGCFGPVADDGYGVFYALSKEDMIFFTITSKYSCDKTSSIGFGDKVRGALVDMQSITGIEE